MERRITIAVTFATAAAALWASYYAFVLGGTTAAPSALLADPFLAAAGAFLLLAVARGEGGHVSRVVRTPATYGRAGLLVAMQVGVLAATYLAGPVDTSLLSLVGDVVLTPVLLVLLFREGADRFRSGLFLLGLTASTAGAALVIVGGAAAEPLSGWAWVTAPAVPLFVALYFLSTARAGRTVPLAPLVGVITLAGGVGAVLLSPLLPGGVVGLLPRTGPDLATVVALGLTSFFLAPYLYFRAVAAAGLVLPALLMTEIPLFTLVFEVALLHSTPPLVGLLGIPVALAGSILALRGPHPAWGSPVGGGAR